jgi:ketosteroid isomerase-like protein
MGRRPGFARFHHYDRRTNVTVARVASAVLLCGLLLLPTSSAATAVAPTEAAAAQVKGASAIGPAALREQYYAALNRGDVAAVVALYADDAVYAGVGSCRLNACVGREAIQREIQIQVAGSARITLLGAQVSGNVVTGRWSADAERVRLAGVERIVGTDTVEIRDSRIVANRVVYDASDPQTARLIEWLETQQP